MSATLQGPQPRPKKICRSVEEKYHVILSKEQGDTPAQTMEKFGINRHSYYSLMRNSESIKETYLNGNIKPSAKRVCLSDLEEVDRELVTFLRNCLEKRIPVSGEILVSKAQQIAETLGFQKKPDINWINRWKKRHGVTQKPYHGEAASADTEAAAHFLEITLPLILSRYSPADIYNGDETGLFYKALPGKTHAFKDTRCVGGKMSKDRLTVLLVASMEGHKLQPLVIGKSSNPRCFKGVSLMPNVGYRSQKKAWMSGEIFREWLIGVDQMMINENRNIALILDNCSAHPRVQGLKAVELLFLPPNTTSKIQPMDAGVIRSLKALYRKELAQRHLLEVENGGKLEVNILLALRILESSWEKISADTIKHCFRHAGFLKDGVSCDGRESNDSAFEEWDVLIENNEVMESFDEYIQMDDGITTRTDEASVDPGPINEEEDVDEPATPIPPKKPSKKYLALQKVRELQVILRSDLQFSKQIGIVDQLERELISMQPPTRSY